MVTVKTPQTLLPEKDGLARNRHALGETTLLAPLKPFKSS